MLDRERPIRIYNQSAQTLTLNVDGELIRLGGFEENAFVPAIANAYMREFAGVVVPAASLEATAQTVVEKPETAWVANITGDPDADPSCYQRVWDKGWKYVASDNPIARPWALKQTAQGGWYEYSDGFGGILAGKHPPKDYVVPPFMRVEMPKATADWFVGMQYDAVYTDKNKNALRRAVVARAPSDFEPDMTWDLDDMSAYLRYIDPKAKLAEAEEVIRNRIIKAGGREDEADQAVRDAKRETMKRLFFRLIDRNYALPSRKQFEEYMHGKPVVQKEEPVKEKRSAKKLLDAVNAQLADDEG